MVKITFISIFLWVAFASGLQAQSDTVQQYNYGISAYLDYGKLVSLLSKQSTKYEGGVGLFLHRHWILNGEAGYAWFEPAKANEIGTYRSEGIYYRVGPDYKMLVDAKSYLALGLRYGTSRFKDQGTSVTDTTTNAYARQDLEADWIEIVLETEGMLVKNVFIGWKLRFRILNQYPINEDFEVHSIPGYGRTIDGTIPAFNFFIKYKIPF